MYNGNRWAELPLHGPTFYYTVYIHISNTYTIERENIHQKLETDVSAKLLSCVYRTAEIGSGQICDYWFCPLVTSTTQIIIWNLNLECIPYLLNYYVISFSSFNDIKSQSEYGNLQNWPRIKSPCPHSLHFFHVLISWKLPCCQATGNLVIIAWQPCSNCWKCNNMLEH